jgi:DNA-binding NarL/FixJ family response regulator
LAREFQPDVILMDINLPVMDGIEATRQIHSEMPDMKILALSISIDSCEGYKSSMMRAGALGDIVKGGESEELYGAIRRVVGTKNS